MLRGLQPIHARHTNIEQHELWRVRRNSAQGLDPVSRFSHDLTDRKLADQPGESFASRAGQRSIMRSRYSRVASCPQRCTCYQQSLGVEPVAPFTPLEFRVKVAHLVSAV